MRHITHNDWYWYADKFWAINTAKSGIRTDTLRAMLGQFDTMLSFHRKVFVFRFDLHLFYGRETNTLITNFNRRLFKRIKRHYKSRIAFTWVREQEKAKQQHYHYVLLLDGSKVNSPFQIQQWITDIWGDYGTCFWAGYKDVERKYEESIQQASYHISYLAKPRGKGYRPAQTKDYGSSRLKKC